MTRRNRKAPARNNRNKGRSNRRNQHYYRNRDRSVLPPAKTLMGHVMRTIVQTAWDIAQGALSIPETHSNFDDGSHLTLTQPIFKTSANNTSWTTWNIDNGWLLAQGWINRFKGLFNQIKVHRITAHYVPYESVTAVGEYVFGLWDQNQDFGPTDFRSAIGTPSSVVRKNGQPAKLVWYPTEPEDRNWHSLDDNHIYCSTCLFQAETAYNVDPAYTPGGTVQPQAQIVGVEGKVIIDVEASFRGKPAQPKGTVQCVCRKCLATVIPNLLLASTSGSTTPFSMSV